MSGAQHEYKFGNKNNWRRWVWNRIAERTPNRRDAVVLYLAGARNLDRPIAVDRGFRAVNMIAIERDADAVTALRASGQLAIRGTLNDVARNMPFTRRIAVLNADLTCGATGEVISLANYLITHPAFAGAVFAFNLLRGRETDERSATLRGLIRRRQDAVRRRARIRLHMAELHEFIVSHGEEPSEPVPPPMPDEDVEPTHRGLVLVGAMIGKLAVECSAEHAEFIRELMAPEFRSYASNKQIFDSVVFTSPLREAADEYQRECVKIGAVRVPAKDARREREIARVRGSMAATFAHHTRRAS